MTQFPGGAEDTWHRDACLKENQVWRMPLCTCELTVYEFSVKQWGFPGGKEKIVHQKTQEAAHAW